MPSNQNFILILLSSATLSASLSVVLIWLLRTWISERVRASIKHEYDQKSATLNSRLKEKSDSDLAKLKGRIDIQADKLRLVSSSFGEAQKASISRKLTAAEQTWKTVLQLHDDIPEAVNFLNILLSSEYLDAKNNHHFKMALDNLDHNEIIRKIFKRSRELSELRLYTGEYLWAIFATYQAVLARTIYLVDSSKSQPEKIFWYEDTLIRNHIKSSLGENALNELDIKQFSKVSWIMDQYTKLILSTMERVIEGQNLSETALKQAEAMEFQLREASRHQLSEL